MVNRELIRRKLNKLIQYLNELETIKKYSYEDYLENFFIKRTTERLLQLVVEVATDINSQLILDIGDPPPKDYYESFILLSELTVIDQKLANELAPSTGLRNRLVHEYDKIDDVIVFESVLTALKMFREYIKKIENYLIKDEKEKDKKEEL